MELYNRYIPQNDGSYRRNPVVSSQPKSQQNSTPPYVPPVTQPTIPCTPPSEHQEQRHNNETAGSFLKGLLPKNLDTGDLLIIILLLLLAGDSKDEKSSALLTLALYLFM